MHVPAESAANNYIQTFWWQHNLSRRLNQSLPLRTEEKQIPYDMDSTNATPHKENASSNEAVISPPPILRLPVELRDIIYSHVIHQPPWPSQKIIRCSCHDNPVAPTKCSWHKEFRAQGRLAYRGPLDTLTYPRAAFLAANRHDSEGPYLTCAHNLSAASKQLRADFSRSLQTSSRTIVARVQNLDFQHVIHFLSTLERAQQDAFKLRHDGSFARRLIIELHGPYTESCMRTVESWITAVHSIVGVKKHGEFAAFYKIVPVPQYNDLNERAPEWLVLQLQDCYERLPPGGDKWEAEKIMKTFYTRLKYEGMTSWGWYKLSSAPIVRGVYAQHELGSHPDHWKAYHAEYTAVMAVLYPPGEALGALLATSESRDRAFKSLSRLNSYRKPFNPTSTATNKTFQQADTLSSQALLNTPPLVRLPEELRDMIYSYITHQPPWPSEGFIECSCDSSLEALHQCAVHRPKPAKGRLGYGGPLNKLVPSQPIYLTTSMMATNHFQLIYASPLSFANKQIREDFSRFLHTASLNVTAAVQDLDFRHVVHFLLTLSEPSREDFRVRLDGTSARKIVIQLHGPYTDSHLDNLDYWLQEIQTFAGPGKKSELAALYKTDPRSQLAICDQNAINPISRIQVDYPEHMAPGGGKVEGSKIRDTLGASEALRMHYTWWLGPESEQRPSPGHLRCSCGDWWLGN